MLIVVTLQLLLIVLYAVFAITMAGEDWDPTNSNPESDYLTPGEDRTFLLKLKKLKLKKLLLLG